MWRNEYRMIIWIAWLFRVDVEQTRENCHGEAVAEVWHTRSDRRTWLRCASLSFRSCKVCNDQLSSSAPSGFPKRPTNNLQHLHAHTHHGATSTQALAPLPTLTRKWWATFLPKNVDFSIISDGWSFFIDFGANEIVINASDATILRTETSRLMCLCYE